MKRAKRIREDADIRLILDRLKISYKIRGDELLARCRSGKHLDRNPSWSIKDSVGNSNNGLFHCFSCGWSGDVFAFVQKVKRINFYNSLIFVQESKATLSSTYEEVNEQRYQDTFNTREPTVIKPPRGLYDIKNGSKCIHYLANRGIDKNEISIYGLKDWRWQKCVWVPITRKQLLITWIARRYVEFLSPQKLYPKGNNLGTAWGLFNYDFLNPNDLTIHLTEGWISAIRVRQAGFHNVVAVGGSMLSEQQVEEISFYRTIVVWKEGDVGGKTLNKDVKEWLGRDHEITTVYLPKGWDPADFTVNELKSLFENRRNKVCQNRKQKR